MSAPTLCDMAGCDALATTIVHTSRANTGWMASYWCERHGPTVDAFFNGGPVFVPAGWWHPTTNAGRVHHHPDNPGRGWSVANHRLCQPVYLKKAMP